MQNQKRRAAQSIGLSLLTILLLLSGSHARASSITTVSTPTFNIVHGFFDEPFTLTLATTTSGAEIRYTIDASTPSESQGTLYTEPLNINTTSILRAIAYMPDDSLPPSPTVTQTYIFLADVLTQSGTPNGYPTQWQDTGNNQSYPADYDMDPDIIDDPAYSSMILDALQTIPTMSLVTEQDNLFDETIGIYQNPTSEGTEWERPTSVELIYPDGSQGFQINAGLRIAGGLSRQPWATPKHSFRLAFRGIYGPTKLEFPLFSEEGATEKFDTITLRARFNNAWYFPYNSAKRYQAQFARDQWARETQLLMGQPSAHGTHVHLYINGLYWGLYNMHERPDASFAATYFGGDKEEYDALNSGNAVDGDTVAWDTLVSLANSDLSSQSAYEEIQNYINPTNLVDYIILNHYIGNTDWDGRNWYAARRRVNGAQYHFFAWDSENIFDKLSRDVTAANNTNKPTGLFNALLTNSEFKQLVADRAYRHFFNDGVMTPASAAARFHAITERVKDAVVAESARWGDYRRDVHTCCGGEYELYTRDIHWVTERTRLIDEYFPERTDVVLDQYKAVGWYPNIDPPTFNQEGGGITAGFTLMMSNPNGTTGTIYYSLDGNDPREPYSGNLSSSALDGGDEISFSLNTTTRVMARIKNGAEWSALHQGDFLVPSADLSNLLITELMYHPLTGIDADHEFVELKNVGGTSLDLGGVFFSAGIDYAFPPGTSLAPGQFFVLAGNPTLFEDEYGFAPNNSSGFENGTKLSNRGEKIALSNIQGTEFLAITYDDISPWPPSADGSGYSLVSVNPNSNANPSSANNWRASVNIGGSPGADDPALEHPPIVINELLAHTDLPDIDQVELYNPTEAAVDIGNWFLTDDGANPTKYQIPPGTTIPANGYLVFDQNTLNFAFSSLGEEIFLFSGNGDGTLTGYSNGFSFGPSANGVSFGREQTTTGEIYFPVQSEPTFGAVNAGPLIGPVVISKIMYNPIGSGVEYVELTNISGADVPLYDPNNPNNQWQLSGIGTFNFPANTTLPANGKIIVVGTEPDTFDPNPLPNVTVLGPFDGALNNGGERIGLFRPDNPESNGFVPLILVDEVNYDNIAPWPTEPDGNGATLARVDNEAYGNEPHNWQAHCDSEASVVSATISYVNNQITLVWQANAANSGGYVVYRGTTPYFTLDAPLNIVSRDSVGYVDDTLMPNVHYFYVVQSQNICGDIATSNFTQGVFHFSVQAGG